MAAFDGGGSDLRFDIGNRCGIGSRRRGVTNHMEGGAIRRRLVGNLCCGLSAQAPPPIRNNMTGGWKAQAPVERAWQERYTRCC
jgi:hypothetical protein